jgi:hypothetical protein
MELTSVSMDTSNQQIFSWIPLRYISGRSDKNQVSRSSKHNQVKSLTRRQISRKSGGSRSPVRMEHVLLKSYCELLLCDYERLYKKVPINPII